MKKSKFILLTFTLLVFVGFSLFFFPVEVNGASEHTWDWTPPESAKGFIDIDGKGIRMYLYSVYADELGDFDYARVVGVRSYTFGGGQVIVSGTLYNVGSGYFDIGLADLITYYLSRYGSGATIYGSDRAYVYFDVNAQRFKLEYHGSDYIGFWIERYASGTAYEEGYNVGYGYGYNEGYDVGLVEGYDEGYGVGYDVGYGEGYDVGVEDGYDLGYDEGYHEGIMLNNEEVYNVGYSDGYEAGYDDARPEMDILLITLIMFIVSVFVYFKFRIKWVLIATILLWFVPIFLVDNVFIRIFSVIMIIVTIVITFFNEREEEYLE